MLHIHSKERSQWRGDNKRDPALSPEAPPPPARPFVVFSLGPKQDNRTSNHVSLLSQNHPAQACDLSLSLTDGSRILIIEISVYNHTICAIVNGCTRRTERGKINAIMKLFFFLPDCEGTKTEETIILTGGKKRFMAREYVI